VTGAPESRELVIVGGGPAGLAAAIEARRFGVQVCLIDERPQLGGQIYKQPPAAFHVLDPARLGADYRAGRRLIDAAAESGVEVRTDTTVWAIWPKEVCFVRGGVDAGVIDAGCLLLATGAYDRPMAFPGWTLPGVMTAGGAQSLVKTQRIVPGERILLAGSGPLVLAFAAQLAGYGANIVQVVEAAPRPGLSDALRLIRRARGNEALLVAAASYFARIARRRIPFRYGSIIVRAEGESAVERALIARVDREWSPIPGSEESIDVDAVCLGYGFSPSTELARLCGCDFAWDETSGDWLPEHDAWMKTSIPGILVAGDGSGVAGSRVAVEAGRLAGISAARELGHLRASDAAKAAGPVRRRLDRMVAFATILNEMYRPGSGAIALVTPDTVVCRCEDVIAREIAGCFDDVVDPNVLKTFTRVGMGRCQGRNCGRTLTRMVARSIGVQPNAVSPLTIRPPVKPVPIGAIAVERPERPRAIEIT
jgi:D-hydroxyproline dehydrogenase subunit alpha